LDIVDKVNNKGLIATSIFDVHRAKDEKVVSQGDYLAALVAIGYGVTWKTYS
jgi:hypothetical protein